MNPFYQQAMEIVRLYKPIIDSFGWRRTQTYKRPAPKIGRNEACPCGSGLKYKKCCLEAL